jgi:hypothetical protein
MTLPLAPKGSKRYHRESAESLAENAWKRVGGDRHNPEAPYLHGMETRQLLMQNAILHAVLALGAPDETPTP